MKKQKLSVVLKEYEFDNRDESILKNSSGGFWRSTIQSSTRFDICSPDEPQKVEISYWQLGGWDENCGYGETWVWMEDLTLSTALLGL